MNLLPLRPKQSRAIQQVHAMMRAGHKRVCLVAPTGSGKRFQCVWWSKECEQQWRRALIVTDRRILVRQMYDELRNFEVTYGVLMGDEPENRDALVQVASIQTLISRGWLDDPSKLPPFDVLFIDECHKMLEAYAKLLAIGKPAIGLTATPVGPDGSTIVRPDLYDVMVEGAKNSELIADGLLLPTTVIAPSEPDIEGVKVNGGQEYNQKQLSNKVWSVTTFANVFDEWAPFADRQTIVFAPGLAYCRSLLQDFEHRGIPAAIIEAATSKKDREIVFEKFDQREVKVLLSVDVLKEGFDAPIASCAIDLQPNSQLRTYWQKVGRIKRTYAGQSEAVYIDMAGNVYRHLLHPDCDPAWDEVTGEQTTSSVYQKRYAEGKERDPITCPKCKVTRQGGPRCPACGFECPKPVRWIRMGSGKLKEIPAERIVKREKSEYEKMISAWQGALWAGLKSGMTFDQCRFIFQKKRGEWPPENLPCMPCRGSIERKKRVGDVYGPQELAVAFKNARSHQ